VGEYHSPYKGKDKEGTSPKGKQLIKGKGADKGEGGKKLFIDRACGKKPALKKKRRD